MSVIMITKETLIHYGVKGMKWGVRKKAQYVERSSLKRNVRPEKIQKGNLRVLKKGEKVQHITRNPNLKPRSGGLYVSFTKEDMETYRNSFFSTLGAANRAKKTFAYDLEVVEDLITPSSKAKVDAFIKMHRSKSQAKLIANLAEKKMQTSFLLTTARILGLGKNQKTDQTDKYRKLVESDKQKDQEKAFYDFVEFLDKSPKIRKTYLQALAKGGFTAMYDDYDMSFFAKEPLIVFNPESSLRITKKEVV